MANISKLQIRNGGTRRIILGPKAKSQGGGQPILLGTKDDEAIRSKAKPGTIAPMVTELTGEDAKRWKDSKVLAAAKDAFGLQVA